MKQHIIAFLKKETVLVIAAFLAVLSMFVIPPNPKYMDYVDFPVLALLFCLMAVVAGLMKLGVFQVVTEQLLKRVTSVRSVAILLVNLCFFSAMLVTNDVALITFVPLTIGIFCMTNEKSLIFVVIMETVAANLGSMLTPIGNPQNLFLFSFYQMDFVGFLRLMLPLGVLSFLLIMGTMLFLKNGSLSLDFKREAKIQDRPKLIVYLFLFLLCLAVVFHLISVWICFFVICIVLIVMDRTVYRSIDYGLLATFICFFVFVGNLGNMDTVKTVLSDLLIGRELVTSALLSQIISNVPAAVMLAGFTDDSAGLLLGVNIGGLGTLVASLASLISFKLYSRSTGAKPRQYLLKFTAINALFFIILLFTAVFLL